MDRGSTFCDPPPHWDVDRLMWYFFTYFFMLTQKFLWLLITLQAHCNPTLIYLYMKICIIVQLNDHLGLIFPKIPIELWTSKYFSRLPPPKVPPPVHFFFFFFTLPLVWGSEGGGGFQVSWTKSIQFFF